MRLSAAAFIVAALCACSGRQQHLLPDFGKTTDDVLRAQTAVPNSTPTGPVTGLDSQEAAIISDSYRASLAPKGASTKEEPILIVQPQNRERPMLPPPSVPMK